VLAIPDATVHRAKLADWLELSALSSPDGRIGFGTLISAAELSKEEQSQDISEDDTATWRQATPKSVVVNSVLAQKTSWLTGLCANERVRRLDAGMPRMRVHLPAPSAER